MPKSYTTKKLGMKRAVWRLKRLLHIPWPKLIKNYSPKIKIQTLPLFVRYFQNEKKCLNQNSKILIFGYVAYFRLELNVDSNAKKDKNA